MAAADLHTARKLERLALAAHNLTFLAQQAEAVGDLAEAKRLRRLAGARKAAATRLERR